MSEPPTQPTDELPDLLPEERTERGLLVRVALLIATGVLFILAIVFWLVPVVTGIPFWILGSAVSRARCASRCGRDCGASCASAATRIRPGLPSQPPRTSDLSTCVVLRRPVPVPGEAP